MADEIIVTEDRCRQIREQYAHREGIEPLAEDHGVELDTLRYHLYGDCGHDVVVEPVTPPVEYRLDADECRSLRQRYADGEAVEALQDSFDTQWRSIIRHLTGSCQHEIDAPTETRDELLDRHPVSAAACAALRERYFETEDRTILDVARDVRWSYAAVQRHINGECRHEITTSARSIERRGSNVSVEECSEMRRRWRQNPGISLEEVASEVGNGVGTVERHIKFRCSHNHEELLIDEMSIFEDFLTVEDGEPFERQDVLEIAEKTNLDAEEVAVDAATPQTTEVTVSRMIRNTAIVADLKQAYEYECQVCGEVRYRDEIEPYAEGHHIKPLGKPHEGPDVPGNILVLCPNHHADFDYGVIDIVPETHRIRHAHDDGVDGETLTVDPEHRLEEAYLRYHQREISVVD